jgi:hypothetical protein
MRWRCWNYCILFAGNIENGRINIKIDDLSIDCTVQFFIYEPLPDLILRINEDFKVLQVSPGIDFLGLTQKI